MASIKELLAQLKLYTQLDMAFADKLDDLEARVYALEEKQKLLDSATKSNARRIGDTLMRLDSIIKP